MIKSIRSNKKSFQQINFKKGLNFILAERTEGSSDKDSRNGLGKSTLIEIIHFCLGASTKPNEGLRVSQLDDWTFTLDLTLKGYDFSVSRNTKEYGYVSIEGDYSSWPIRPEYDSDKKAYIMPIRNWNEVLGFLMFGLPINTEQKYSPSYRSIISYFIRKGLGAFNDPFKQHPNQYEWDIQTNNAYLLGLNWQFASEFQILKDKAKLLENLKKAANEGLLIEFTGSIGELEAEEVRLSEELVRMKYQLNDFKVHPQYYKLQKDANKYTDEIHLIANRYTLNQQIFNQYKKSIEEEKDVSVEKVKQVYENIGLIFPKEALSRLDDVNRFHKQIIENRKDYLKTEIDRLSREIEKDKLSIENISNKRAELLGILQSHGALDEYNGLQKQKNILEQKVMEVIKKINDLKKIEDYKSELNIKREELLRKTRRDFQERTSIVKNEMSLFNKNSEYLYSEPGTLSIDITDTGYKFKVEIKRARSQGVNYMKIFCYDLVLMQLRTKNSDMPGFIVHDSTIFDGVDERQIAKALELASTQSEQNNFQYICTINSDIVPYSDFSSSFKDVFKKNIVKTLSDKTENGGLLGIRY